MMKNAYRIPGSAEKRGYSATHPSPSLPPRSACFSRSSLTWVLSLGSSLIPYISVSWSKMAVNIYRVLINSKFGLFYSNFLILTPTFSKVPIEKYGKIPFFSGKQHFYSFFQNPSENSDLPKLITDYQSFDVLSFYYLNF